MGFIRGIAKWFLMPAFNLFIYFPVFAAEQGDPRPYPWSWRPETCWSNGWWIFPFMFFILMIVLCFLMRRRGGMACFRQHKTMSSPEGLDPGKRYRGDPSMSALEILNRRYADGEINKQEYEEKKTDILSSRQSGL